MTGTTTRTSAVNLVLIAAIAASCLALIFSFVLIFSATLDNDDVQKVAWARVDHIDQDGETDAFLGLRKVVLQSQNNNLDGTATEFDRDDCTKFIKAKSSVCEDCDDATTASIVLNSIGFVTIIVLIISSVLRYQKNCPARWHVSWVISMLGFIITLASVIVFVERCYNKLGKARRNGESGLFVAATLTVQLLFLWIMHIATPPDREFAREQDNLKPARNYDDHIPGGQDLWEIIGQFPQQPPKGVPSAAHPFLMPTAGRNAPHAAVPSSFHEPMHMMQPVTTANPRVAPVPIQPVYQSVRSVPASSVYASTYADGYELSSSDSEQSYDGSGSSELSYDDQEEYFEILEGNTTAGKKMRWETLSLHSRYSETSEV